MARNKFDVDETLESPFSFSHLKRAIKYVKKYRFRMLMAILLNAATCITSLFGPKMMEWTLDIAVPNRDFRLLGLLALGYVALIIAGIVCITIRSRIMVTVSQGIIYDIREDLFAHLQKLPFSYYDSRPAGKILVRVINYVNSVSDMLSNGIINMLLEIMNIVFIIIFMFTTNVMLAAIIVAGLPVFVLIIALLKPRQRKAWQDQSNKTSNYNAYLAESIDGVKVSQLFSRQEENVSIMKRLAFSMPFSTPKNTITAVMPIKRKNHPIGSTSSPVKFPKYVSSAAAPIWPVTNTEKYFMTQPPITL